MGPPNDAFCALGQESGGCLLWSSTYNGDANLNDHPYATAVDPSGKTLYVTGESDDGSSGNFGTTAVSTVSGETQWSADFDGESHGEDAATSVAVHPKGNTVYVTGLSLGESGYDYQTLAYNSVTGEPRWRARYDGPNHLDDIAISILVSQDGKTVAVSGVSAGAFVTVGYEAATGTRLWVSSIKGVGTFLDWPFEAATSDGILYFTGSTFSGPTGDDVLTVAIRLSNGKKLWDAHYTSRRFRPEIPYAIAVSPDGRYVYCAGLAYRQPTDPPGTQDYLITAYSAADGRLEWVKRFDRWQDMAQDIAVGLNGRVFVTGRSSRGNEEQETDALTLALDQETGRVVWKQVFDRGPVDEAFGIAARGGHVYVTGSTVSSPVHPIEEFDVFTDSFALAYDEKDGSLDWMSISDGGAYDASYYLLPLRRQVIVVGDTEGTSSGYDYSILAYGP